eukprot:3024340-Lingulodinium_polyedra.AAC.1
MKHVGLQPAAPPDIFVDVKAFVVHSLPGSSQPSRVPFWQKRGQVAASDLPEDLFSEEVWEELAPEGTRRSTKLGPLLFWGVGTQAT